MAINTSGPKMERGLMAISLRHRRSGPSLQQFQQADDNQQNRPGARESVVAHVVNGKQGPHRNQQDGPSYGAPQRPATIRISSLHETPPAPPQRLPSAGHTAYKLLERSKTQDRRMASTGGYG